MSIEHIWFEELNALIIIKCLIANLERICIKQTMSLKSSDIACERERENKSRTLQISKPKSMTSTYRSLGFITFNYT